ncbi:hypothetical protein, conserved [Leishmania tarentolae]|uniref:Uncharacterized protein n=1 Tax=Leishmania tarentolae TaxID=5689 RepID=A0A640KW29_LEITA|nr:hypothetical protein, conserved [Leishmania tarentolae]
MKLSVVGVPLASTISLEAEHSDTFESILKKVQEAAGKATPLGGYDLYTARRSSATGELVAAAGPLRSTDTLSTLQWDLEPSDSHILILKEKGSDTEGGSTQNQFLHSTATAEDMSGLDSTTVASTSPSSMTTPRVTDEYRRRMRAMYLKYDPGQIQKVDVALDRYRGYEEDVLQQLVKRYGPEPMPGEVDLSAATSVTSLSPRDAREMMPSRSASPNGANSQVKSSYYDRLVAIYSAYEPAKLSKVNGTLRRYAGREEQVIQQLVKRYGPEPSTEHVAATTVLEATSDQAAPSSNVKRQELTSSAADEEASAHVSATLTAVEKQAGVVSEVSKATQTSTTAQPVASAYDESAVVPQPSPSERRPAATAMFQLDGSLTRHTTASMVAVSENKTGAAQSRTIGSNYRERLVAFYKVYNPAKLHTVEGTLKKFAGKEEVAIQQLVRRYGPEPAPVNSEEACRVQAATDACGMPSTPPNDRPATTSGSSNPTSLNMGSKSASSAEWQERKLKAYPSGEEDVVLKAELQCTAQRPNTIAGELTMSASSGSAEWGNLGAMASTAEVSAASPASQYLNTSRTLSEEPVVSPKPASPSMPEQIVAHVAVSPTSAALPSLPPSLSMTVPPTDWRSWSNTNAGAALPTTVPSRKAASLVGPMVNVVPVPAATPQVQESKASQGTSPQRMAFPPRALRLAAAHVEGVTQMSLRERYWIVWRAHHAQKRAAVLLEQKLWVEDSANAAGRYRLNDAVEPAYTVSNLSMVVAQEERGGCSSRGRALSSELQIATRTLLSALRHCVESRVIQVQSREEHQLADAVLAHWAAPDNICPVTDSPELACALRQAGHLISKLEDLVTVIRTQAGQLHQLKALHRDVVERMEHTQAHAQTVGSLEAQLRVANRERHTLEQELKRLSAGIEESHSCQTSSCRVYPTAEQRKDAQIAKLQQALAKTRNSLFLSKEAENKLKVQLEQSHHRDARRKHEECHLQGKSRRCSVSNRARAQSGSRSARIGSGTRSLPSNSPYRGCTPVSTPRGAFSYAIAHDTPRSSPNAQIHVNGGVISSIRRADAAPADQDRASMSVNSRTPWPSSRYVMASTEVERGPCPNCLLPLTSCCHEEGGPVAEKAAFCFSCRRYFTFGELWTRDAHEAMELL